MLKGKKRQVLKVLLGIVLITLAAFSSLLLKETLDSTDPENNLPLIEASVGGRYDKIGLSDEMLWERISTRDAADFDVFAVNTAELQRYIDRGLVVPLALDALPNRGAQLARFRDPAAGK